MGDSRTFEGRRAGCRPEHFLISCSTTGIGLFPGPRGAAHSSFRNLVRALQEFRFNGHQLKQGPFAEVQQERRLASFLQLKSVHIDYAGDIRVLRRGMAHIGRSRESIDARCHSFGQEVAFRGGGALLAGGDRGRASRGWRRARPCGDRGTFKNFGIEKEAEDRKAKERGEKARSTKKGSEKAKEGTTVRRLSKRARPGEGAAGTTKESKGKGYKRWYFSRISRATHQESGRQHASSPLQDSRQGQDHCEEEGLRERSQERQYGGQEVRQGQ